MRRREEKKTNWLGVLMWVVGLPISLLCGYYVLAPYYWSWKAAQVIIQATPTPIAAYPMPSASPSSAVVVSPSPPVDVD